MTLLNGFGVSTLQRRSQRIAHQHLWNTFLFGIPFSRGVCQNSRQSRRLCRLRQTDRVPPVSSAYLSPVPFLSSPAVVHRYFAEAVSAGTLVWEGDPREASRWTFIPSLIR